MHFRNRILETSRHPTPNQGHRRLIHWLLSTKTEVDFSRVAVSSEVWAALIDRESYHTMKQHFQEVLWGFIQKEIKGIVKKGVDSQVGEEIEPIILLHCSSQSSSTPSFCRCHLPLGYLLAMSISDENKINPQPAPFLLPLPCHCCPRVYIHTHTQSSWMRRGSCDCIWVSHYLTSIA